jgi:SP family arabinose:H+ symporter-like MFS transporter
MSASDPSPAPAAGTDTARLNRWPLIVATFVSSLGGFLFGYDNIVISGAIEYLTRCFQLDAAGTGWAAGCALVGCLAGSAGAGAVADRIGLRKSLYLCAACFALSSAGVLFAGTLAQFVAWRMLGGLGIGAASILAPMYIAEIAPTRIRGRLVTLYQLGIVLGIFSAVLVNMLIQRGGNEAWNIASGWKWMFFAGVAPALVFGVAIALAVESPRWLMKVGRREEALAVLTRINGWGVADTEAGRIETSLTEEQGRFSELFTTGFRRALVLGIVLAGLSQTSGITPLFSYLPEVFKAAGAATSDAFFQTVLVSVINTVFTLLAIWLVDRAGRRTLILAGTTLQFAAFATVGWLYWSHGAPLGVLAGVMAFVAGHAFGNGAVCWVIISEIFPTKVRGRAMSIATTSLWVFAYLGNQVFPLMQKHLGNAGAFWIFAMMALVNFFYVFRWVPETKGHSLEDIEHFWQRQL